ncbi:MAG: hypothetical protein HDR02_15100 [Lachnospiraceae bacterium]|nr:hypothetical protein [Lachnospiraceae bacterium]
MSRILPILFNTEMDRAILDNRKTATRRKIDIDISNQFDVESDGKTVVAYIDQATGDSYNPVEICRYRPGDILYIRETWAFKCCIDCMDIDEDDSCMIGKTSIIHEDKDTSSEGCYIYRADHPHPERIIWRPSIHMPKAAARTWLGVTAVKIQRLQEMTLDDFLKEGVVIRPEAFNDPENAYLQAQSAFIDIWDSTIPKEQRDIYGWQANPWVTATEFKKCEKPESEG